MHFTSNDIWQKLQGSIFVIAEAGKNFIQTREDRPLVEYLQNAKNLVDAACDAGADAIKFQTHCVEDEQLPGTVVSPHFKDSDRYAWVERNTRATPVDSFWKPLKEYCDQKGIIFFSTPMSREAAQKLADVGVPLWKIGSADILDFVCMDFLRKKQEPIIMSTGMSTLDEIESGVRFLKECNPHIALMHCLSKYPGLPEEANLAVMDLLRERFPGMPIGFSENSVGSETCVIAAAKGATIIEKHLTISREFWGPDHKISSTPEEFKHMTHMLRAVASSSFERQKALNHPLHAVVTGTHEKIVREDEGTFRPLFRKSLVAGRDIAAGTVLKSEMVYAMRPQLSGTALPSEKYESVVGRVTAAPLKKYEPFTEGILR